MRAYRTLWMIAAALLIAAGCKDSGQNAPAEQQVKKRFEKDSAVIEIRLSSEEISLSDLLVVEIQADCPVDHEVSWPDLAKEEHFKIRDWEDLGKKISGKERIKITRRYELEPDGPGELVLGPFEFRFQGEEVISIQTETIPINVTVSIQPDAGEISIADIEDVVEVKPSRTWLWAAIIGGGCLPAVLGLLYCMRPKKDASARKVYKPAHEIALKILRQISQEKLPEQGRIKEFYERLSDCLRHYIEDRFQLRAPEQTTEEFMQDLKDSGVLESEHKEQLKQFLLQSDLVKFAKHRPEKGQTDKSLEMAESFIENTKSEECQIEMKGQTLP